MISKYIEVIICVHLLIWLLVSHVNGATISGTVVDGETGEALAGAQLILRDSRTGDRLAATAAGTRGAFSISLSQSEGSALTLSASFTGYRGLKLAVNAGQDDIRVALVPTVAEMNPVVVSASLTPETILDAPVAVTVVDEREIGLRQATTPSEYVIGKPAVDVIQTGLNQYETSIRGFNGMYQDNLLTMLDGRDARIPNFRVNIPYHLPINDYDLESIEIVSGPAAALYGSNSAYGVIQIRTKSPFDSPGDVVMFGAGERDIFQGAFRHAAIVNDKLAYKISTRYFEGRQWEDSSPLEPATIVLRTPGPDGDIILSDSIPNTPHDHLKNLSADFRLDYRHSARLGLQLSGGLTRSDFLDVTQQGRLQGANFLHGYTQAKLTYDDIMLRAFFSGNNSSNDDLGYFLNNGLVVFDDSRVYGFQAQQSKELGSRENLTYGVDASFTRPVTGGTFHGRNEHDDDINELGAYLESRTELDPKVELLLAGRLDHHNLLEDLQFSPRAAITYSPRENYQLRFSFNRAFTTPNSSQFFWDFLAQPIANPYAAFNPAFEQNLLELRVRAVGENGFSFARGSDGRPLMNSQFDGTAGLSEANVNAVWPTVRQLMIAQNPQLETALPEQLSATVPAMYLDLFNNTPVAGANDIERLKPEITTTFEIGLKSLIADKRVMLGVNFYHSRIEDRINYVYTPAVFINPATFAPVLAADIAARLVAAGLPPEQAAAQAAAISSQVVPVAAQVPIGVVSPEQDPDPNDVYQVFTNAGEVSLYGGELSIEYKLDRRWNLGANYSYVSENFWADAGSGDGDVHLNAPKNKFGAYLTFNDQSSGYSGTLRYRWVDAFPAEHGIYSGVVESYQAADMALSWRLPFSTGTKLNLTVKNIFDNRHREFVGAPVVGRLGMINIAQEF